MSCKVIVPKTAVIVFVAMIKVIAMKLLKFLIAKSFKLGDRYLISTICMLLFACRIFSANNNSNWKSFWRMKSRIKPNCKQSYFNSKVSSVNLRFSKLASLQPVFSHDAKTMQWWNIGFILCDRSFNDFPNCLIHSSAIMFADDTSVFLPHSNLLAMYEQANDDLHNIHNWLVANKHTLNVMKTKYILFRTPHSPPPPSHMVFKIQK